ncbi:MAG: RNA polymerase sigma-70 factor, ECF subfamily [Parcubacteria group bacterium Athens1014_10]|nr:MAG: RNA polymerase sigma-70 factor, ECF subfamily [Parcubacteria group bacterium Athens1014_10]TSD04596.1 MAG: RNA polymerase sigma-70 factor, ECF subfamily [Parcubacteria group bacterium Athens0714_12]
MFKKIREQYLISKIKKGDKEAFSEIYNNYLDKIYRFVYFKVSSKEIAEDLTSDTFLKILKYIISSDKQINNLQAFVYQTAKNLITDHYRQGHNTIPLENVEKILLDNKNHHLINDDLRTIEKALSTLKNEYKEIITLCHLDQLSIKEASQILQKPAGTVRVTLHRALKALREKINKE